MRYNRAKFESAIRGYQRELGKIKGKAILIHFKVLDRDAFYSIAPLSRAVHELGGHMNVSVTSAKTNNSVAVLKDVWDVYTDYKAGKKSAKVKAMTEFVKTVDRKAKNKKFIGIFRPPEIILTAGREGFASADGKLELPYRTAWFRKHQWKALMKTARAVWKNSYDLKKHETASIGFELIPAKKDLDLPLQDYLDSFAIARAMILVAKKMGKRVSAGSSTAKWSQLEPMGRVSDLSTTLLGCEYEKDIDEIYFRKFRRFSKLLRINRLKPVKAGFGIHGKGYGGKHFFGMVVGYPTPDKKSRWQGPGRMFLKPHWLTQTKQDTRMPQTRYAITGTLPIPNFIRTCDINYAEMRRKNEKIKKVIEKCSTLFVKGNVKINGRKTDLEVDLSEIRAGKTFVWKSDSDVRSMLNKGALKNYGAKAGMYGNCPGGEAFLTPNKINGTALFDVVISIDQSYVIPNNNPLVVKFKDGTYRVVDGPKKIMDKMIEKRREARKIIAEYRKTKSVPEKILKNYERNFMKTGEFAINTNPKAKLSRYLIETEKIARMMHIAMGSGYEPNRETLYHWDAVINSPRQKNDIYGVNEKGEKFWIIKKGRFVV